MNTKFFVTVVILITVLAILFTFAGMAKASQITGQADVARLSVSSESDVRMWSGEILFSDNDYPDFKPYTKVIPKQAVTAECISKENIHPRRHGGCIQ